MEDKQIKNLGDIPASAAVPTEPAKASDKPSSPNTPKTAQHDNSDPNSGRVIRVKADPPDISDEERSQKKKALAAAIAYGLKKFGEVQVRAFGDRAVSKAAFAIGIASGLVSVYGCDLYCRPCFIQTVVEGRPGDKNKEKKITGISFLVVSSETTSR
jgi:stage V sporulation protein SpoVS